MKKLLLFLLLLPTSLYAQTSICGVDFGTSYSTAERILENKFGDKDILWSDKTQLVFRDKMYAGRLWSYLYFIFQSDGVSSYLNRCILVIRCKTLAEAKEYRDAIKQQMDAKYPIADFINEKTKLKYYLGGTDPTNYNRVGFCIDIIKLDNGEYSARLDYGPYNYVKEEL